MVGRAKLISASFPGKVLELNRIASRLILAIYVLLALGTVTVLTLLRRADAAYARGQADAVLYAESQGELAATGAFRRIVDSVRTTGDGIWLAGHGVVFYSVGVCSPEE